MPIYALKTGLVDFGGGSFRVELHDDLAHGAMLAYDVKKDAFVDVCLTGLPISGGISLGGANAHTVLAPLVDQGKMQFKEIVAGDGIDIVSDDDSITISANDVSEGLSVPGDFRITIDNDNDQNGEARFEIFTVTATEDRPLVVSTSSVVPLSSSDVYTGNHGGLGYFEVVGSDFWLQGFRPGMAVRVTNAANQSGSWTVGEVERRDEEGVISSRLLLTESFSGEAAYNMGGPKPNVLFEHFTVVVQQGGRTDFPYREDRDYRLDVYGVDLGVDGAGLVNSMIVQITGTPDNDGVYAVDEVTGINADGWSSLLVHPNTPFSGTSGLQEAANVTFEVRNIEASTGFYVTSSGHLQSRSGDFDTLTVGSAEHGSYVLEKPNDVVRADNLDRLERRTAMPFRYFLASL